MATDLSKVEIPEEIQELLDGEESEPVNLLDDLAKICVKEKAEAIAERENSGIDDNFALSEEAYAGIDDANRHEHTRNRWIKPTAMNAPITTDASKVPPTRSTAFVRITTRYTDAGAAKISEISLSDKPFNLSPMPVPEIIRLKNDRSQVKDEQQRPMFREMRQDEAEAQQQQLAVPYGSPLMLAAPQKPKAPESQQAPADMQVSADQSQFKAPVPYTKKDYAIQQMLMAEEKAKRAETRIWDWWLGCEHVHEMRKALFDSARLGVGVIKGPYPEKRSAIALIVNEDGTTEVQFKEELYPAHCQVDPWNIFPSSNCGEHIRDGDYLWERAFNTEKTVHDMIGLPGYNEDQIKKVLEGGPKTSSTVTGRNPNERDIKNVYETWHRYGLIRKEHFEAINPTAYAREIEKLKNKTSVFAIVTMINDVPVRGSLHYLETEKIPYHNIPWQRRPGSWAGVGVPEQMSVPQRITNASVRAVLNNAGITAGPQIILSKEGVSPADGDWTLTPNKVWHLTNDGSINDVQKAFFCFDLTNVTPQLLKIVDLGLRLAEESTNIPLVTQGQSGVTTPDTFGQAQLQDNNANQLLRNIAGTIDGYCTEPLLNGYYEYLLLDPKVPGDEKGVYKLFAKGTRALVDRAIQDQTIAQMGTYALNPAYGVSPKKWFAMYAKSRNLRPEDFQYSPEEQAEIDSRPPELPPQVQVAQINAQSKQMALQMQIQQHQQDQAIERELAQLEAQVDMAIAKLNNDTQRLKIKMDTDRDTVYVEAEMKRAQATFEQKYKELEIKRDMLAMQVAANQRISVDQAKVKLADTSMKLRVQKELTAAQHGMDIKKHTTPSADSLMKSPAEVPGRATNGNAFVG